MQSVTEPRQMSGPELREHYRAAIAYLDERFAYFLTHVLNMGEPRWDARIPTAAVGLPDPDSDQFDKFHYLFGRRFASTLTVEELAFVMAHETMHIMLGHLKLARTFPDKRRFNLAADAAINDWLAAGGFAMPREEVAKPVRGMELIGTDCSQLTVTEIYRALEHKEQEGQGDPDQNEDQQDDQDEDQQDGQEDGGEGEGQEGAGSQEGESSQEQAEGQGQPGSPGDEKGQSLDDHDWMWESTDHQRQAGEEIVDQTRDQQGLPDDVEQLRDQENASRMAGYGQGARMDGFCEQKGVSLKWAELLREINPEIFRRVGPPSRPSYHRPRRKLVAHYPKVMLPVERPKNRDRGGEGKGMVMALDTSGSIRDEQVQMFLTLARSVPQDKLHLEAMTFTTAAEALDLEKPYWHGGGTDFSAIEDYIQNVLLTAPGARYPNSVVVVTDGYADFRDSRPKPEHEDRWLWLLTEGGMECDEIEQGLFGRARPLKDYVAGL